MSSGRRSALGLRGAVLAAACAGAAAAQAACRPAGPSVAELGPPPVRSIEPGRPFERKGVVLRVDSVLVGPQETAVFMTLENRSRAWVETRGLREARLTAAGQEVRARAMEGLSAGSPGVVAPGQSARGRVVFPPLPGGSLGLRMSLPLTLEGETVAAEFVVRLERGWRRL